MSIVNGVMERPILMSDPMVRAILDGRKFQTRRVLKVQAPNDGGYWRPWFVVSSTNKSHRGKWHFAIKSKDGFGFEKNCNNYFSCPYGKPGDRLWVRETFLWDEIGTDVSYRADFDDETAREIVEGSDDKWRPSKQMPRWASRILLEVKSVGVERLQDISEEDAIAEGAEPNWSGDDLSSWSPEEDGYLRQCVHYPDGCECFPNWTAREWFIDLWGSINGDDSWNSNPWVWLVEFERVK